MASPSPQGKRFGAPTLGSNVDAGRALKLAQRVEQTLKTVKHAEPKILDPDMLLVSPQNRDGSVPNLQYVHFGILRSLAKSGFDRSRPAVGIAIEAKSPEAKQRLLEWNRRFTTGVPLMPPIHADKVLYGTLAGTHLNIALRLLKAGVPSPACDVSSLMADASSTSLREVVEGGHKWWILPEETPLEEQVQVSRGRGPPEHRAGVL